MSLRRQVSFLVLKLKVLCDPPVVILPLRNGHKFICILLGERIPLAFNNRNWDHGLTEDVLVALEEVPDSESGYHCLLSLLGTRNNQEHVAQPREFNRVNLPITDCNLIKFLECFSFVYEDAGETILWACLGVCQ